MSWHGLCVQVEVVAEVDGWLHCVASNGAKGLVPSSYVRLLGAGESSGLQQQYSAVCMHAITLILCCQLYNQPVACPSAISVLTLPDDGPGLYCLIWSPCLHIT